MRLQRPGFALAQCSVGFLAVLCGAAPGAQQTLNGPLARPVGRFSSFQVTPDGGRVVFAAEQDRYYWPEVYSVPVDGSSSSVKLSGELVGPDDEFHSFLLSPDGSRVVSVFEHRIMSAPVDGSAAAILIAPLGCSTCDDAGFSYCFTPDGAHLLYRDHVPGEYELYFVCSVPVDGSGPVVRLSEPDLAIGPSYYGSPDGKYVVLVHYGGLYGRPIDGSAPAVLLNPGLGLPWASWTDPLITLDGIVLFRAAPSGGATGLYAAPIDGGSAPVQLSGSHNVGPFALLPDHSGAVYRANHPQDGRDELFTTKLDGSVPPVLISGSLVPGGNVGAFALLPDGSRVVYVADALLDGRNELFVAPFDASAPPLRLSHTLAPGGNVDTFELAPAGTHAVYWARENGVVQLFSARIDRSLPAQRLNGRLVAGGNVYAPIPSQPAIAPDGRTVVYLADQRLDGQPELFSVPIDGSMRVRKFPRRLNVPLPAASPGISRFYFAPDAGRVLYGAEVDDSGHALYSVPLRGGPSVRLSEERGPGGSFHFTTQTSLPGARAVFVQQKDYTTDSALLSVPFEGGTALRLNPPLARGAPDGGVRAYRSSPDGRWTVYLADQEVLGVFDLYSVPTEGGVEAVKLNGALPYGGDVSGSGDEWQSPDAEGSFEITPDGSRVVYMADQDVVDEVELYVAPIDGLTPAVRLGSGGDVLPGLALDASSERVVFRLRDAQGVERLFSQRLDGSEVPLALSGSLVAGGNVAAFAITPDGTGAVFRADAELDNRFELYFVRSDGSAPRRRVSPALGSGRNVSSFALTKDSRRVLFLANPRLSQQFELFSTELVGGLPLELDPELGGTGSVRGFVSSPDGAWAVFAARPPSTSVSWQLYAVPCNGSAPPHRVNGQLAAGGSVRSEDGTFLVSPDSGRIVYLANENADSLVELRSVPVDGSSPASVCGDPLASVRTTKLHISPDSRRVFYVASYPPFYPPTSGLFAVGIGGAAPPLLLSASPSSGDDVYFFDVDSFGLNALYSNGNGLFYVPTDASRPPRYVDSGGSAAITGNPRFALYLTYHGNHALPPLVAVELHSFQLPIRLRHGDPPEAF